MNAKAFGTTILMGVIALVMCGAAYIYYPKIYVQEEGPGKDQPLFESYENSQVRYIKIDRFDQEQNVVDKIQLAFVAGRWVIPARNNFLASNAGRVAAAMNSLKDRKILDVVSDRKEDHVKYGVVDISETSAGTGTGTVVTLEDRNNQPIGSLIVGEPTKNPGNRYVRIPGQPQIYEIEFNDNVLATDFAAWVDGNLLRLDSDGSDLAYVQIDKYLVDAEDLTSEPRKKYAYRVRAIRGANGWTVSQWLPDAQQQIPEQPTAVDQPINPQTLLNLIRQLTQFPVQDVKKKADEVAEKLANPQRNDSPAAFASTQQQGFRQTGMENGQHQFVSVGGEVSIQFNNGARYDTYIGSIAGIDLTDGSRLSRFAMITAEVDESRLPMPTREGTASAGQETGEESTESETQESSGESSQQSSDDEQERAYQRLVQEREQKLQAARQQAGRVNQVNADWYYVIGESVVGNLFPDLGSWIAPGNPQ